MRNHLPGITISALVHTGLFALAYAAFINNPITLPVDKPDPIALKLSMFVPPPPPTEPVVVPEPEPVVKVIEKPKPPPPKPIKKPRPKPKLKKQPKPEPVIKAEPEPVLEPEIVMQPPPAIEVAPPKPVDTHIIDEYKLSIRRAIEANKRYPRKARRLRQQGTVTLAFTILRDGAVKNLRITQSAGADRLDQAALKAIEKISGRYPLPAELNKASWDFNVPIQYSLR